MPRQPRTFVPGVPVHLIQRGNNRSLCFFKTRDYHIYLDRPTRYSRQFSVAVHSYVLMTNHVHMLVTPGSDDGIARMMQTLGAFYVRHINKQYERSGTLWEGRYKDCLVDSERYFMTVSRYIELNPVRAQMCQKPAQYPWSSFRRLAAGVPDPLVCPHATYQALGACDKERQTHYCALFQDQIPERTLNSIRDACNKSWVLGDETFKRQMESQLGRSLPPFQQGRPRK